MSVQNASIAVGPTISITNGTAVSYTPSGQKVNNGINIVDTSATDYRTRPNISLRGSEPAYDKDGVCVTKSNAVATCTRPKILASGAIDFPCGIVQMKLSPESTDAEILAIKEMMVQVILDADFANFWKYRSIQ